MSSTSKFFKVCAAVVLSGAVMFANQGCSKEKAAPQPAATPEPTAQAAATAPAPSEPAKAAGGQATPTADGKGQVVELAVTENGYEPSPITVKQGVPVTLKITRKTETTCATEIVLPEHQINTKLPLNETVEVNFTPNKTGKLKYGCAMGMMLAGVLLVE